MELCWSRWSVSGGSSPRIQWSISMMTVSASVVSWFDEVVRIEHRADIWVV